MEALTLPETDTATGQSTLVATRQLWFPDYPCRIGQVRHFRDRVNALLRAAGGEDALFHNHRDDGTCHYAHPAQQYRSLTHRGREVAGLWGLGEAGLDALALFEEALFTPEAARLADMKDCVNYSSETSTTEVQITDAPHTYLVRDFALNQQQAALWRQNPSRRHQDEILEKALRFGLFGLLNAVPYRVPDRSLAVRVLDIPRGVWRLDPPLRAREGFKSKGAVLAMDVAFEANLLLPDFAGLGIHKAFGWGVVQQETP